MVHANSVIIYNDKFNEGILFKEVKLSLWYLENHFYVNITHYSQIRQCSV